MHPDTMTRGSDPHAGSRRVNPMEEVKELARKHPGKQYVREGRGMLWTIVVAIEKAV